MNTKQLKSAAEELIEVLGLVDETTKKEIIITKKTPDEDIIELIKEAAGEINPDDDISDETRSVIEELVNNSKKAVVPGKGKKEPEPELEEDEDEDAEPDEDEDAPIENDKEDLINEIEDAETVKDLKSIVASFDFFKETAKKLNTIKDVDDMREAMLELINASVEDAADEDGADVEDEPEEILTPKKGKKVTEPAPKETKKPAPKKEKALKAAKEPKAPKAPKVKKEKVASRQDFVIETINALCKKGATLKQIMLHSDELYVKAGGETNPTATNVNNYTVQALVAFNVLLKDDKGVYKLNK
jgi:hypothetical protein